MEDLPETLARADGVAGEVVLRRRRDEDREIHELIVNGTFLMDTAETSTERLLAEAVLSRLPRARHVLVGGLGLGFTTAALLESPTITRVDVAELEPLLVEWSRAGLVPGAADTLADPRVTVRIGDIRHILHDADPASYDAILLDVDNGPDFLVREDNAEVYRAPAVRDAAAALRPGGIVAVWSAAASDRLHDVLAQVVGPVEVVERVVAREGRDVDYHVYLATRVSPPTDVATEWAT